MRGRSLPKYPLTPDDPLWPTCKCGCGEPVKPRPKGSVKDGTLPGEPFDYRRGHTSRIPEWRNGRKRCGACGEFKPPSEFHANGGRLKSVCDACKKAYNAAYRQANRERLTSNDRAYGEANRERINARIEEHKRANPETYRPIGRRRSSARRARKLGQFVEHVDPLVVLERDDNRCGICGLDVDPLDFHVDHVIPLALGGEHSYMNTQTAHPSCNSAKRDSL